MSYTRASVFLTLYLVVSPLTLPVIYYILRKVCWMIKTQTNESVALPPRTAGSKSQTSSRCMPITASQLVWLLEL